MFIETPVSLNPTKSTDVPTPNPTTILDPNINPTSIPSKTPTIKTINTSELPSNTPTLNQNRLLTDQPTHIPTKLTLNPTILPSVPIFFPSINPTRVTQLPSVSPNIIVLNPTFSFPVPTTLTTFPTLNPSIFPTIKPSKLAEEPTLQHTINPSIFPTPTKPTSLSPSILPTKLSLLSSNSSEPTLEPTLEPTIEPTLEPTPNSIKIYSDTPSLSPTLLPTENTPTIGTNIPIGSIVLSDYFWVLIMLFFIMVLTVTICFTLCFIYCQTRFEETYDATALTTDEQELQIKDLDPNITGTSTNTSTNNTADIYSQTDTGVAISLTTTRNRSKGTNATTASKITHLTHTTTNTTNTNTTLTSNGTSSNATPHDISKRLAQLQHLKNQLNSGVSTVSNVITDPSVANSSQLKISHQPKQNTISNLSSKNDSYLKPYNPRKRLNIGYNVDPLKSKNIATSPSDDISDNDLSKIYTSMSSLSKGTTLSSGDTTSKSSINDPNKIIDPETIDMMFKNKNNQKGYILDEPTTINKSNNTTIIPPNYDAKDDNSNIFNTNINTPTSIHGNINSPINLTKTVTITPVINQINNFYDINSDMLIQINEHLRQQQSIDELTQSIKNENWNE